MDEKAARMFVQALGCKQIERKGKWLTCTCPLAPFTHSGGKDNHPSFGIRIGEGLLFNCFACESGSLGKLLNTLGFHLSKVPQMAGLYNMKAAHEILDGAELDFLPLPPFEEQFAPDQVFEAWPDHALDQFAPLESSEKAVKWLAERDGGLTLEQAHHAELMFDHTKNMVVAPYRNVYGRLAGVRGRNIDPECPKAYRHSDYYWNKKNNAPLVWYNEQALMLPGPLVVVEGQFDCRHVEKVWPKVIANLTAKPSRAKLKKIGQCDQVILMMDNDDTGRNATEKYKEYLASQGTQIGVMEYPEEFSDPAKLPLTWLQEAFQF